MERLPYHLHRLQAVAAAIQQIVDVTSDFITQRNSAKLKKLLSETFTSCFYLTFVKTG